MYRKDFEALGRRRGRTVWVSSPQSAKRHAQWLGISLAHTVATVDEAKQRLAQK